MYGFDHSRPSRQHRRAAGVTLLELLIAVAIVGILAAIAIPSYAQYVIRTNRSAAKSVLLQVADRQEQFFGDNKTYATDLTRLGYASDGFMIDDQGAVVAAGSSDRLYAISLTDATANTFTVNATPQLNQATRDVECQTLTLSHTGQRDQTGASANCW